MSRKLKFFSDQINKAGVKSSVRPALQPEIDLEELEVLLLVGARAALALSFYHSYIINPLRFLLFMQQEVILRGKCLVCS